MIKESPKKSGTLEVICGPMFSGKSEELIRRIRRAQIAQLNILVLKHAFDNRSSIEHVISHNGTRISAYAIDDPTHIASMVEAVDAHVIGIDEVQFFPATIIPIISQLVSIGKRVIVAGLDLDFRGIPFGPMPTLLAIADKTTKLFAICTQCNDDARFSQRLINGNPARYDDPIILVGAQEAYQARCRNCFKIDKALHNVL